MAPRDGQSRPERGHGVDCRQRRTNRTFLFVHMRVVAVCFIASSRDHIAAVKIVLFSLSLRVLLLLRRRRPFDVHPEREMRNKSADKNKTYICKQSTGPPPEKIVTLAGIIAPRMVSTIT